MSLPEFDPSSCELLLLFDPSSAPPARPPPPPPPPPRLLFVDRSPLLSLLLSSESSSVGVLSFLPSFPFDLLCELLLFADPRQLLLYQLSGYIMTQKSGVLMHKLGVL